MSTTEEKATWLAGLLTGWGIKEIWAKVIAGAVIGALAALGGVYLSGCSVSYTKSADGDVSYNGSVIPAVQQTSK